MSVIRPGRLRVCTVVLACLGVVSLLGAAPPASIKKEPPKARRVLVKAYKKLAKVKGFQTSVAVLGGVSDRSDHKVTQRTVKESYEGIVSRRLMFVSSPKAFRTTVAGKGAVYDGGWKRILGTRQGVLVDRLFVFPQEVLARAVRYSRSARWVKAPKPPAAVIEGIPELDAGETDEGKAKSQSDGDGEDEADTAENSKKGRTAVAKTKSKTDESVEFPGVIRVDAPTKEALRHFNYAVLNSGCLSAG